MRPSSRRVRVYIAAAIGGSALCGCASSHGDSPPTTELDSAYQALAGQLKNCNSAALDCVKAASCDDTKERACRDAFDSCRSDNRALLQTFERSVQDCRDTRAECVADARNGDAGAAGAVAAPRARESAAAGSAGAAGASVASRVARHRAERSAITACRHEFAMCVEDHAPAPPPAGPCLQGFHDCVVAGDRTARECFEAAHTCYMNRLPMCGGATAGGGGGTS